MQNIGKGPSKECHVKIDFGGVQGVERIKALEPGEFDEITYEKAKIDIGQNINYTFIADKDNLVMESDENNNVLTGTLWYNSLSVDPPRCSDGGRYTRFLIKKK